MISTFQHKFNRMNPFSHSWDISRQSFYSYWWPDISFICCHFCASHTYADSPHLGLSSATYFVKISPLVVKIQAEWSLWHKERYFLDLLDNNLNSIKLTYSKGGSWLKFFGHFNWLCVRAIRFITNHASIGEYWLRFFLQEEFSYPCR